MHQEEEGMDLMTFKHSLNMCVFLYVRAYMHTYVYM